MKGKQVSILIILVVALAALMLRQPELIGAAIKYIQIDPNGVSSQPVAQGKSSSLNLDAYAVKTIKHLTAGVVVLPKENNIGFATQLDHGQGRPLLNKRKYKETYEIYQKILKISYDNDSLMGISIALGVMGHVFKALNEYDDALDVYMLAYQVALQLGNPFEYGVAESSIAKLMHNTDKGMALMWRLKAKEHLKGTPHLQDYVILLTDLADDLAFFNKDEEALTIFAEAFELSKKISENNNIRWVKKQAAYKYTKVLTAANDCKTALPILHETLSQYSTDSDKEEWYYISTLILLGDCYSSQGENELANQAFLQAYASYELTRSLENNEQQRAKNDNANTGIVNRVVKQYISLGDLDAALLTLETNKGRTLADIQQDEGQAETYESWHALRIKQAKERDELFDVDYQDTSLTKSRWKALMNASYDLEEEQRKERFNQKLSLGASRQLIVADRMSQEQLGLIKAELASDTAVISIFSDNEKLSVFVITKDKVQHFPSELSKWELARLVRVLRTTVLNPYVDYYMEPSQTLYKRLFKAPVESLGSDIKHLIYIGDGNLVNVPPGLLHDGNKFLTERFTFERFPSLRYLDLSQYTQHVPAKTGITCVDPENHDNRLPFQRDTSEKIKDELKGNLLELTGKGCNESNLKSAIVAASEGSFMHIGAHGRFYERDAMLSGFFLSSEKNTSPFWNAMDIATVDMNHINLVTLSSCETGVIDEDIPRDMFGVLRSMFYSGVNHVVAPVWTVDDLPTSQFMQYFYADYFKNGFPALSVQKAQLKMLQEDKYRHPYFWAAFTAVGVGL